MKLFGIILILFSMAACQPKNYCAVPDRVKMKRSKGYSMKAYRLHLREKSEERKDMMAQRKQLLRAYNTEGKDIDEMEDWDCPRPNSKHARQVKKQMQKKERMHEDALKKDREKSDAVMKDLKEWAESQ
jgi:hypothetical protein